MAKSLLNSFSSAGIEALLLRGMKMLSNYTYL